ncbi:MAG TPA: PQQ-dependent sugar dehydrogenase [Actinomycetota bacterium]
MRRMRAAIAALALIGSMLAMGPGQASGVALELVATNLTEPIHVTNAGDGSGRLFIVERAGIVKIVDDGQVLADPFIDISAIVGDGFLEQGLLSIAFHPGYATNGSVFLSYTDLLGRNVLARYHVDQSDANKLDPGSAEILLTQLQPFLNHNGGLALFGPDGYLYMGIGDGGTANDPAFNGQNAQTLLGTIIRIDVDVPSGYAIPPDNPFVGNPAASGEVWAYGLRNPWRFSFDAATGDLYIADVGQNVWEEINVAAASSPGGENYGWNRYEGNHEFQIELFPPITPYVFPALEYNHDEGCSVTGGDVYRGPTLTALTGAYVFGDYCTGRIWSMTQTGSTWSKTQLLASSLGISSFGTDEAGEIYVAHLGLALGGPGAVYKLVAA